jgi:AraC-like DNA-binding protein
VANCFPSARQSVSRADFENAVTLARLIVHDLEVSAQAQMATRRWHASNAEISRLRDELGRRRPPGSVEPAIQPGVGSRTRKVVLTMIEYVRHYYRHPMNLEEVAAHMKMNASYLSGLFSQTTGVSFHKYLEELRLSTARELLRDSRNRISEVAYASGYASPDAFRHAFKAHEGMSPDAWRVGR